MEPESFNVVPGFSRHVGSRRAFKRLTAFKKLAVAGLPLVALLLSWVAPAAATTSKRHHHTPPPPASATGQPAPTGATEAGVSCATASLCWSVGTGPPPAGATAGVGIISVSHDAGKTWVPQVVPPGVVSLAAISCPTSTHCMAGGATANAGAIVSTHDGGTAWVLEHAPAGSLSLAGVQCSAAGGCLALSTNGTVYSTASSNDYGQTWTTGGQLPPALLGAGGLFCEGTLRCLVAGYAASAPGVGAGVLAGSTDGGETWTLATLPTGVGLLHGVSCEKSRCIAVGTTATNDTVVVPGQGVILQSLDGGVTWHAEAHSRNIDDAFGVSCTVRKTCVIVGTVWIPLSSPTPVGGVITSTDGGTTWRPAKLQYLPESVQAVDCASSARCVAAGSNALARIALPVKPVHQGPKGIGV